MHQTLSWLYHRVNINLISSWETQFIQIENLIHFFEVGGEVNPEEERDIHFQPIVKLPDNVDIVTGEEQEVAVFVGRGKLYRFDGGVRQWKERGVGDMKIMKEEETDVYAYRRMRRDQIHKVFIAIFLIFKVHMGTGSYSKHTVRPIEEQSFSRDVWNLSTLTITDLV